MGHVYVCVTCICVRGVWGDVRMCVGRVFVCEACDKCVKCVWDVCMCARRVWDVCMCARHVWDVCMCVGHVYVCETCVCLRCVHIRH